MSVSTELSIRDSMSAKLNKIARNTERLNAALRSTDAATEAANPSAMYDRAAGSAAGATSQVERFNERQERATGLAQGIGGQWGQIGNAIRTAAAALGLQKIVEVSDSTASIAARLELINDGLQTTAQLQDKIMASANRSKAVYTDVANTVSKLGILAGESFSSNDEMIAFAELMNKNFIIGGSSPQEQAAAMYQLTQAMASGRLQGDEFRSIMENAPLLAGAIADFTGKSKGELKEMSAEGTITAEIIKGALFNSADEIESRFSQMPMTWGQVWSRASNAALVALQPVLTGVNWLANNIEIIGPLVLGLGAAFLIFQVAAHWTAIAGAVTGAYKFIVDSLSLGYAVLTGKTGAASAATLLFNSALLASPITWIVMLIVVLIAALYAGVAMFNKFTNSAVSATGIIGGAFSVLLALIANTFFIPLWNIFASLANFFGNLFQDPVAAVKVLFYDLAQTVIGYILNMARGIETLINKIPGVQIDITSGLDSFYRGLEDASQKVKDESGWVEYVGKMDFMDYTGAAKAGYQFGVGLEDKVAGLFNFDGGDMDGVYAGVSDTAANTGKLAESVNIADEDIKFLRDVAEMRYVQNFVTLTPTVAMNANISEKVDVKSVVAEIERTLEEEFAAEAEGVYA